MWDGCLGPGLLSLVPGRRGRVGAPAKYAPPASHIVGGGRVKILQSLARRRCDGAWVRTAALRVRRSSGSPRPTSLQLRGLSATSCCLTVVAGGWVGELVPFHCALSPKPVVPFGATGSVGGLGSTQIQAEPGKSRGRGATSLPAVKYPAGLLFALSRLYCMLSGVSR